MKRTVIAGLSILYFSSLAIASGPTGKFSANTEKSKILWVGTKPGGSHNGIVKIKEGKLEVENGEIKGGKFTIGMNSIENYDLQNENMNARLVNHLKSDDFFSVDQFAESYFEITNVRPISGEGKNTHGITGDLTIKGITKEIRFDARIRMTENKVTALADPFELDRTDWDVNFKSKSVIAGLKDNYIDDIMLLSLSIEATK